MKIVSESLQSFNKKYSLNEYIFSTGLSGNKYSSDIILEFKNEVLNYLDKGTWKKTPEIKQMFTEAERRLKMWSEKKPKDWPGWFKHFKRNEDGTLSIYNFTNPSAISYIFLKETIGEHGAISIKPSKNWRTECFFQSIEYKNEHPEFNIVGGIIIKNDNKKNICLENLVVHAFNEKNRKYYDPTFSQQLVEQLTYFPLFLYEGDSEDELAKMCWKYANSIEAAIEEKDLYIAI